MRTVREPSREIPVAKEVEVLVAGGGTAGMVAGLAAARNGADTLVVERYGFLGGALTANMINVFGPFDNGERWIIGGIPKEILHELIERGASLPGFVYWRPFDSEVLKLLMDDLSREAGVKLLFHTLITGAIVEDGQVRGIIVENKAGRQAIIAKQVIDASGDADVAALAGAPWEMGRKEDGLVQPVTLMYRLFNVDVDKIPGKPPETEYGRYTKQISMLYREAKARGELTGPREAVSASLNKMMFDGEVHVNHTRVVRVNPLDPDQLTEAELASRQQMREEIAFFRKYVPEFANSVLERTAPAIGVRESRRILGEYILTEEDLWAQRRFEDRICLNFYPIDIHSPIGEQGGRGQRFPTGTANYVPYRSLLPQQVENLLVAGRCISATHEATSAIRGVPTCMAMGQVAGTAAALCVKLDTMPRRLDVSLLQSTLRQQGAIVD